MAYGTPSDPVGGTVITTAYAVANILNPIRWLRLLTGNADPPGSSYVVVSDSTTGTTWRKIPSDALAAGVALANLTTGSLTLDKLYAGGTANRVLKTGDGVTAAWAQIIDADIGTGQIGGDKLQDETVTSSKIAAGTIATADMANNVVTGAKLQSDASVNANRAVGTDHLQDAAIIARVIAAEAVTEQKLDVINSPSDAQFLAYVAASGRMQWQFALPANINSEAITEPKLDVVNGPSDDQVLTYDSGTGRMVWTHVVPANIDSSAITAGKVASDAITEPKLDIDNSPTDAYLLSYVAGSGRMRWVAAPSGTAGVPAGLTAFFSSAAALAAATGWSAYTAAAGRLLAATGSVFGMTTFTEGGNFGSSWDHSHTGNTWTGGTGGGSGTGSSAAGGTGTGTTGGPDGTSNRADGANSVGSATHGHSIPSLSIPALGVSVTLSVTGVSVSGNTEAATFVPPLHALPMGQKS